MLIGPGCDYFTVPPPIMLDLSEFEIAISKPEIHDDIYFQALISSRDSNWCATMANEKNLLDSMVKRLFSFSNLNHNLIKVVINIPYQVESAKYVIADTITQSAPNFLPQISLYSEESFLLTRLFFILSTDKLACQILSNKCDWMESSIVAPTMSSFTTRISEKGIESILDACNIRYLQTSNDQINYQNVCNEATSLLKKCPLEEKFVSLIGASFHVLSAVNSSCKPYQHVDDKFLSQALKLIFEHKCSPDYRPLILNVALVICREDEFIRRKIRHIILPCPDRTPLVSLELWKEALCHPDVQISFSSGEFLFFLCENQVPRLISHLGFGPCAGYLHMKGLLHDQATTPQNCELSSDEEYFLTHPSTPDTTKVTIPQTEEEITEYESLMAKISEFNSRATKQK